MATTPNLSLILLDVGQKQKEATINDGFTKIDTAFGDLPQFLGDAASNPSTAYPDGSTYYNTTDSKLKVLRASGWSNAA